jgi:hypothetical protein
LDQVLQIPGQTGYVGRGVQIVRGNIFRGRPTFLDSLNIRYLDKYGTENLPINDTLHGGPDAICADGWGDKFWNGPVVAYLKAGNDFDAKKMTDMNLTTYRDAIDYLAYFRDGVGSMIDRPGSEAHLSKRVMETRAGKVKGVRVNCSDDQAGDPTRQFVPVNVPRMHPLFGMEGDGPLVIMENLGESWVVYRYTGYQDPSADESQNANAKLLLLAIAEYTVGTTDWGKVEDWHRPRTTGSLLIVNRSKEDLDVCKVQAACRLIEERIVPLLSSESREERQAVLEALTPEALEQYM